MAGMRVSREQELGESVAQNPSREKEIGKQSVDMSQWDYMAAFDPSVSRQKLTAPKALPGMEQQWVAVSSRNGANDVLSVSEAKTRGWLPRPPETVDKNLAPPTIQHSNLGHVIAVNEMVLMHRPIAIGDKFRAVEAEEKKMAKMALHTRLKEQEISGHPLSYQRKVTISKGNPSVADD